ASRQRSYVRAPGGFGRSVFVLLDKDQPKEERVARFPRPIKRVPRLLPSNDGVQEWEPERQTIEAAQTGDLDALSVLYDSHINQVYRYALARLGNVHDAEDVAEEIFLKML